ncbi:EF-hand domain-containing protein [Brevundimonas nasdae]|uniref:EF-hand domain-containing protein n=1 Tax=Brevundimonas nasdae TaxID=172043 RepID=A0ABX8TGQ2_9CAUL|nr:EF-hand domain-containing protein [Brevundimonas nasdae]QYC10416.1 EF-hand domain-containing protein [Brevundimonas nasdae]QYC13203.1 EF-hand domain-containing protein [Brevundimonas nasdae]
MKKTMIGGAAAIALAAVSGMAVAQTAAPGANRAPNAARAQAAERSVTQAEFVEGRLARLIAADTNRDGTVTPEEMQAARQAQRTERLNQRFAKLDANGDGSISRAEFDAANAPRAERGPRAERAGRWTGQRDGHRGPMRAAHRGARGPEGARERGPIVIADVRAKLTEQFAKLDTNHDGVLTAAERRAGWQARGEQRREGRAAHRQGLGQHRPGQQPASPAPASE